MSAENSDYLSSLFSLAGKVAVVAGATRGAGRGIAHALGEAGAIVYCTGRSVTGNPSPYKRAETIDETAEMIGAAGGTAIPVRVDHTVESEVEALFARIDREHGHVDIAVNSVAGEDPLELLDRVKHRVVTMHASDRYLAEGATLDELRQSDGTLGYSPKLRHGVTGKGLNDYDAIFRILAEHDYRGWVSIEDGMNGMGEMAESLEGRGRTDVSSICACCPSTMAP